MREFPSPRHLQFLLNDDPVVTRVMIDAFQMSVVFANGWQVTAMEKVVWSADGVSQQAFDTEWRDAPPITFHAILDRRLTEVTADDFTMTLKFEGECWLRLFSTVGPYESVTISDSAGRTLVV